MKFSLSASLVAIALLSSFQDKGVRKVPRQDIVLTSTKRELMQAIREFDLRYAAKGPIANGEEEKRINEDLENSIILFLKGRSDLRLKSLNELIGSLAATPEGPEVAIARSLRIELDPPVFAIADAKPVTAHVTSLYPTNWAGPQSLELALRVEGPNGMALNSKTFRFAPGDASTVDAKVELALPPKDPPATAEKDKPAPKLLKDMPCGVWKISVTLKDRPLANVGTWWVVPSSLDKLAAENDARLAKIQTPNGYIQESITICRARNKCLNDHPDANASREFDIDPCVRSAEIASEIPELEAGKDPYQRRAGDLWRLAPTVLVGEARTPLAVRIYAPEKCAKGERVPALMFVAGMGWDENSVFDAFGQGKLKQLAEKLGFLLISVAPHTPPGFTEATFDELLNDVGRRYEIDPRRVYLAGNGVGAGQVARIPKTRWERLAALLCIGDGDPRYTEGHIVPSIFFGGTIDQFVAANEIKKSLKSLMAASSAIDFEEGTNLSSYLLLEKSLEKGVTFLVSKHLD